MSSLFPLCIQKIWHTVKMNSLQSMIKNILHRMKNVLYVWLLVDWNDADLTFPQFSLIILNCIAITVSVIIEFCIYFILAIIRLSILAIIENWVSIWSHNRFLSFISMFMIFGKDWNKKNWSAVHFNKITTV